MNSVEKRRMVILSGPVHSGNSGALMQWVPGKSVSGFITPTINNKKVLFNIETGETDVYEMNENDGKGIEVGNYRISKEAFVKAKAITTNAIQHSDKQWFVVDEIGKLELRNEGNHAAIVELLDNWKNNLLFVIRDYLLQEVINKYQITDAEIIDQQKLINLS
ncbi:MAG TPA: nucleoside-triphosphatase [Chitinophagaceae bacterium]|nr:nucleoside-triphosphatase [Chitinophagaceae bacterium]